MSLIRTSRVSSGEERDRAVHDQCILSFGISDSTTRTVHLPQLAGVDGRASSVTRQLKDGWLPAVETIYDTGARYPRPSRVRTPVSHTDPRGFVLVRLQVTSTRSTNADIRLCASINPAGPSGFNATIAPDASAMTPAESARLSARSHASK